MPHSRLYAVCATLILLPLLCSAQSGDRPIDPRIWSIQYWQGLARDGRVAVAPERPVAAATPNSAFEIRLTP